MKTKLFAAAALTCTMVETGWIRFMFFIRLSMRSPTLRPIAQLV